MFVPILCGAPILVQLGRLFSSDSLFALRPRLMLGDLRLSLLDAGGVHLGDAALFDGLLLEGSDDQPGSADDSRALPACGP